jgi:hypothetical protein
VVPPRTGRSDDLGNMRPLAWSLKGRRSLASSVMVVYQSPSGSSSSLMVTAARYMPEMVKRIYQRPRRRDLECSHFPGEVMPLQHLGDWLPIGSRGGFPVIAPSHSYMRVATALVKRSTEPCGGSGNTRGGAGSNVDGRR